MEVLENERNLGGVEARGVVGEAARLPQMREELAADDVLHHEVEVALVLEGTEQVDDVREGDLLEHELLGHDVLDLLERDDLGLFEDLERDEVLVLLEACEAYSPEGAGAQRVE